MSRAKRILIVDDEPNVRLVFRTALESSGYAISDGRGRGGGPDLAGELAGRPGPARPPDARHGRHGGAASASARRATTSRSSSSRRTAASPTPSQAMKLGAIDFLAKPLSPDDPARVVAEVLARHAAPSPSRPGRLGRRSP